MVIRLIHLEAHIHVGHLRHLGVAALLGVRRVHACTVDPLCHPVILAALQMLAIDVTIVLGGHWYIINALTVSCQLYLLAVLCLLGLEARASFLRIESFSWCIVRGRTGSKSKVRSVLNSRTVIFSRLPSILFHSLNISSFNQVRLIHFERRSLRLHLLTHYLIMPDPSSK